MEKRKYFSCTSTHQTDYEHDIEGYPVLESHTSGLDSASNFDTIGRLTNRSYTHSSNSSNSSNLIFDRDYDFGVHGNISSFTDNDGSSTSYQYDVNGRVSSETYMATDVSRTIEYGYDADANLISLVSGSDVKTLEYDQNDRLLSFDNKNYSWDANGNLLSVVGIDHAETMTYNSFDELLSYIRTGTNPVEVNYEYGTDGLLISRQIKNGEKQFYTWDRTDDTLPLLLEQLDSNKNLIRRFFNDGFNITHSVNWRSLDPI